ncbi:hypothetical protein B9479_007608 [Cryptococcus floricola]|uniref:Transmembrane protein n=1 Tax=Cryptococcus floricola TaxID=2591691 RepID=A0A5D3AP07_9TREE|nr:hypothetical protein B9479_007608 [Cryptococcus floricola]
MSYIASASTPQSPAPAYGFICPPLWLIGMTIMWIPLRPVGDAVDAEKAQRLEEMLVILRRTELKYAKRYGTEVRQEVYLVVLRVFSSTGLDHCHCGGRVEEKAQRLEEMLVILRKEVHMVVLRVLSSTLLDHYRCGGRVDEMAQRLEEMLVILRKTELKYAKTCTWSFCGFSLLLFLIIIVAVVVSTRWRKGSKRCL